MNITVTIQHKHMLGNSWTHRGRDIMRLCPLHEALTEMLPKKDISVFSGIVRIDDEIYKIPNEWSPSSGTEIVENAQKTPTSVTLTLIKL